MMAHIERLFRDREDAGRHLAAALERFKHAEPIILALPRGGVPVAFPVARALNAPLDVVFVRKLGAPGHEELGIGAVVDGSDPHVVLNEEIVQYVRPTAEYLQRETQRQLAEIERRRTAYRGDKPPAVIKGRTVVVVDDGIATGGTVRAVLRALRLQEPARLVLAVPVAPRDTLRDLAGEADEIVCLATPEPFYAVGLYYLDFGQTTDDEVRALLRQADGASSRQSQAETLA